MKGLYNRFFPQGDFFKNVLTLMTGTTIAQIIPLAISPILSRIYSPDEFGLLAVFLSITAMIGVVSTGRYELAIVMPKKDDEALNLVGLSIFIDMLVSIFSLLIIFLFHDQIIQLIGNPKMDEYLYLIPLSVLFIGIYQTFNFWANRRKYFNKLARSKVSKAMGTSSFNLGYGVLRNSGFGLIGGEIFGQITSTLVLATQIYRHDRIRFKRITWQGMKKNAIKYQEFPKVNSLHAFTDYLQATLFLTLITIYFGNAIVGLYSFALKIIKAPMSLIGLSISQVFLQKASETYNEGGSIYPMVKRNIKILSLIAFPIFIVLFVFGSDLFRLIFGAKWTTAGWYAQILAPWIFLNFVISPLTQVPIILKKQRAFFLISLVGNIMMVLLVVLIGYLHQPIELLFYLITGFQSAYTLFVIIWILHISKNTKHA